MAHEIITLETLALEIARLRGELATWKALAIKQDRLGTAQIQAVNSGATAGKIAQIATNTANITALQQIVSGMFRVVKVAELPATGEPQTMYLVPQTDGTTLNYCNEYLWIDNAWELVGTTGAMANNGELQIIVNGVTVGTFTANQATDSTATITVPTDTADLTNGAGYIDATALTLALAAKQDSLTTTQMNAVNSGITSASVAQIGANTSAISGLSTALGQSLAPSVDNTYSLGGASFRYANVYAVTFTGDLTGTASRAIADEDGNNIKSSYGKLAGANTWTQTQTFQSNINLTNTSYTIGTIPSTTAISACYFAGASNSQFGYCRAIVYKTTGQTSAVLTARNRFTNGALAPTGAYINATFTVNLDADGTGWIQFEDCSIKNDLIPYTTDTYSIGTSTKKWKTFNGINPGALSLPDFTSETGVSLSAGANTYTPTFSGWLSINTTGDISVVCGNFCHKAADMISVPVIAGKTYTVTMPSAATGYFYSCLGNV